MWMMGYNEGAEFNLPDSFSGRKLRPLIPRPSGNSTANNNGRNTTGSSCLGRTHGTDLLAFNHHMATMTEQSKREFTAQQVSVSSRWNPTPEQLHTLEELYRRGTRTPSTEEIQQITAQLRRYGKIEGKNVFYWFQNHKARERQKRRRQLESAPDEQQQQQQQQQQELDNIEDTERKESGANRTGFEAEQSQAKKWPPPTNCTSTLAQKTVSLERAAKTAAVSDGWIQFDEGELQNRRSLAERNATWQMMQLSCSPHSNHINYITPVRTTMDPKLIKAQNLNIFIAPPKRDQNLYHLFSVGNHDDHGGDDDGAAGYEKSQTLQLFPLRSGESDEEKDSEISMDSMKNNLTPSQFIEFLPLKN